jgi:hypothetical protein
MTVSVKLSRKVLGPHHEAITDFCEQRTKEQSDEHDGGEHHPAGTRQELSRRRQCHRTNHISATERVYA